MSSKVPYFLQERNNTCGVAALRMVLHFLGDKVTEKELVRELNLHSFGTFSTDLGASAIKRGFKVKCFTFHLSLLGQLKLPFGTKIDQKILEKIKVSPKDKMTFQSWQKFIKSGGELIWDYPKIELLKKTPGIISVNTAALGRYWKNWRNGHYLVVNEVKNNKVHVLDPDPIDSESYYLSDDLLLTALIVNAVDSSDYLLLISQ